MQLLSRASPAVREKKITLEESTLLLRFYENGMQGYTYLEEPHER